MLRRMKLMTSSAWVVALVWLSAPAALSQEPALDPSGLPAPAWYSDKELGLKWERLTGKYIFQRSCTECHSWGPQKFTRAEWSEYLESFPGNHAPPVSSTYSDLTALFTPAAYVPDARQLNAALSEFLLHSAAASPVAERSCRAAGDWMVIG